MSRIGGRPPMGNNVPSNDPSRNRKTANYNGRRVSVSGEPLGFQASVASKSGYGTLRGRAELQDTAEFASGTNFAIAHMYKG